MSVYIKVTDVLTRSPHLSERWKSKYRKELRLRMKGGAPA